MFPNPSMTHHRQQTNRVKSYDESEVRGSTGTTFTDSRRYLGCQPAGCNILPKTKQQTNKQQVPKFKFTDCDGIIHSTYRFAVLGYYYYYCLENCFEIPLILLISLETACNFIVEVLQFHNNYKSRLYI